MNTETKRRDDSQFEAPFGDGVHTFRLTIDGLRELEGKLDSGPMQILSRLAYKLFRADDVRETIRIGLVDGGMKPMEAIRLVDRYASEGQLQNARPVAMLILGACLYGVGEDGEVLVPEQVQEVPVGA